MESEGYTLEESAFISIVNKRVTPAFGEPFQLNLGVPKFFNSNQGGKNKIAITCFISRKGSNDELGAYIYSIIDSRTLKVYQTILNNSSEDLLDLTKRLSLLITKKYKVPSYVSISGDIGVEESMIYIKEVLKNIDESSQAPQEQEIS
ncbi:hypothetical protein PACTADRAFT_33117 [Pachysolen tannophilus NRRL Y-2460]|uniref:Proteasome assembly chaperone 3 n=1 Tax=Pachysolen tannophilus NRRL Y-2460 TaxID=669874 RepID=A0A1E4TW80_PACTA|nr:hypothetical protein PACTADRAFT_33117 [Pachysolen tannophilus NRRL Y-2460]